MFFEVRTGNKEENNLSMLYRTVTYRARNKTGSQEETLKSTRESKFSFRLTEPWATLFSPIRYSGAPPSRKEGGCPSYFH